MFHFDPPWKRQKTKGLLSYFFKNDQKGILESNGFKKLYLKSLTTRTTEKYPFVQDMHIHTKPAKINFFSKFDSP